MKLKFECGFLFVLSAYLYLHTLPITTKTLKCGIDRIGDIYEYGVKHHLMEEIHNVEKLKQLAIHTRNKSKKL